MKQRHMAMVAVGVAVAALTSFGAIEDNDEFALVTRSNGSSYIQIKQDLDSFSFHSDFKSIGNSGKVGYVVYPQGLSEDQFSAYLKTHADNAQFAKKINNGLVDLGTLKAGDRVGFYLDRNNGDMVYKTVFVDKHGTTYLEFDKNGGTGKDEWMSIGNVKAVGHVTAGGPLPGFLAVLLVGGLGAGAMRLCKRRA